MSLKFQRSTHSWCSQMRMLKLMQKIRQFPSNPNNMTLPSRDSGVFLYMGWRFLNGDIPYRDIWDHKPPLIYFVDALGIALTPHSLWGVWVLRFLFIFFTLFLIYK